MTTSLHRVLALLATTSLGAALLSVAAPVAQAAPGSWCDTAAADAPCIVSLTRDGVPITSADPDYAVTVSSLTDPTGTWQANWWVYSSALGDRLPPGDAAATFVVTVDVRTHIPRFSFNHSTHGTVVRSVDPGSGDHLVTLTASPVTITQGCDGSGVCPAVPVSDLSPNLDGWIYDPVWYADQGVPASAWNNASMWTNVDWTEFPPQATTSSIVLNVANSHVQIDGTTPVQGFVYEDLPYALVKYVLGIDDPYALVGGGVLGSVSGTGSGTVAVTVDDTAALVHVAATNLSFSKRAVVVRRGVIVPRAGVVRAATRTPSRRTLVRVSVAAGISRGSRVTGYQARCYRLVGTAKTSVRTGYTKAGAGLLVKVANVSTYGTRYCQVRVGSRAGYGPWSKPVRAR